MTQGSSGWDLNFQLSHGQHLLMATAVSLGASAQLALADTVDNDGGNDGDWDITIDAIGEISESNFAIWDDTNGVFVEGGDDDDFAGTGSGILLFDPAAGLGDVDEASGRSTVPFLPVTYSGGDYSVEQYTFAEDNGEYVIIQLTVTNNSDSPRDTKLTFANDFDMDGLDLLGYEADLNIVWQQTDAAPWTVGGSALISGNFADWRLGDCCDMTDPDEGELAEDFVTETSSGDQITSGDREVASLANLGTLNPNESACTAWVYAQTNGPTQGAGVTNMRNTVQAAISLYNTIPESVSCGAIQAVEIEPVSTLSLGGPLALISILLGSTFLVYRRV